MTFRDSLSILAATAVLSSCAYKLPKTVEYCHLGFVAQHAGVIPRDSFSDTIVYWHIKPKRTVRATIEEAWKATIAAIESLNATVLARDDARHFMSAKIEDKSAAYWPIVYFNMLLSPVDESKSQVYVHAFCRPRFKDVKLGLHVSAGIVEDHIFERIDYMLQRPIR